MYTYMGGGGGACAHTMECTVYNTNLVLEVHVCGGFTGSRVLAHRGVLFESSPCPEAAARSPPQSHTHSGQTIQPY